MRTLLIDNRDSYTFNLHQLIAEVTGEEPVVVRNDDPMLEPSRVTGFDGIVISPGPGRPQRHRDTGRVPSLLDGTELPVLGVCLGHQAIATEAGARVGPAPRPRHGHLTRVRHTGDALFHGVPNEFTAVRYHSLCVEEPLPRLLEVTARSEDGVIMALRHRLRPRWGVQFHPESIASEHGRQIISNFRDLSLAARPAPARSPVRPRPGPADEVRQAPPARGLRLTTAELPQAVDTEAVFRELYAASPDCFWLDSSRVESGLSRFSFLGDVGGPLGEVLSYRVGTGTVRVRGGEGPRTESGTIFDVLGRRLRERRVDAPELPFDFTGGYVGWFGYEAKADCGARAAHRAETPDAVWAFADRLIAVDHQEGRSYVLAVHEDDETSTLAAKEWVTGQAARIAALEGAPAPPAPTGPFAGPPRVDPERHLLRDRNRYQADIAACLRQLERGESYEICLTNQLRLPFDDDDTEFYRRLRRVNPAPYAALLRLDGTAVFCSSPERFLRIDRGGLVESKPIKGTAPRDPDPARDAALAAELAGSAKTRAENLMIVDLLRNDLGRVCEIGSVRVDRYMAVESYATVHQLVSTIQGQLRTGISAVECVRRCFPGGSMTGAPKERTMEIIDRLETGARGVYSGALGYFGLSGGADLNIVIRTAVRSGDTLGIGAGGAIVLDSDEEEEFQEMLLKASATLRAWRPGSRPADGGS